MEWQVQQMTITERWAIYKNSDVIHKRTANPEKEKPEKRNRILLWEMMTSTVSWPFVYFPWPTHHSWENVNVSIHCLTEIGKLNVSRTIESLLFVPFLLPQTTRQTKRLLRHNVKTHIIFPFLSSSDWTESNTEVQITSYVFRYLEDNLTYSSSPN